MIIPSFKKKKKKKKKKLSIAALSGMLARVLEGNWGPQPGLVQNQSTLHVVVELGLHESAQHKGPRPHREVDRQVHRRATGPTAEPRPAAVDRQLGARHRHLQLPLALPRLVEVLHLQLTPKLKMANRIQLISFLFFCFYLLTLPLAMVCW